MHTHFASGMFALASFLGIVIVGTFWKLAWMTIGRSQNPTLRSLAAAALFQYN